MVFYCCVAKGNQILYSYSCGDPDIEKLAVLCLDRAPAFHTWYFQSVGKKTYGFLMEDEYVYFTIVEDSLGNQGVLQFLGHIRDEFKKILKGGSRGSLSVLNSVCLQEQLVPVIQHLINSLEQVSQSQSTGDWMPEILESQHPGPSPSPEGGQTQDATSSKAPLLRKFSKKEQKKMKDRVIDIRDNGSEGHRKSMGRGINVDLSATESDNQGMVVSSLSVQKSSSSMRNITDPQHSRYVWWRRFWIIIVVDIVICLILFGVWLKICGGFQCFAG